jgi:hypothetical protein
MNKRSIKFNKKAININKEAINMIFQDINKKINQIKPYKSLIELMRNKNYSSDLINIQQIYKVYQKNIAIIIRHTSQRFIKD